VDSKIAPALTRLVSFLENEYLPASRASTGWSALPNGAAWYAARIKDSTNLPLTPDAVHALGLKEVARIQQQLAALFRCGECGQGAVLSDELAPYYASSHDSAVKHLTVRQAYPCQATYTS